MRTKNLILIIIAVVVVVILAGLIVYNYTQDSDDVANNITEEENNQTSENNTNESNTTSSNSSQGSTGSSSSSSSDSDSNVTYGTDPTTGAKTKTVNGETYTYSDEYQDYVTDSRSGDEYHMYNPDRTIDEYTNEKTGHMWGTYDGKEYDEYQ